MLKIFTAFIAGSAGAVVAVDDVKQCSVAGITVLSIDFKVSTFDVMEVELCIHLMLMMKFLII